MPPTIPKPSQLATQAQTKLQTLVTLTRAGIVHPERPDRLWNTARALLKYGTTPAAGYTAAARKLPGRAGDHRRARHADLQGGRPAHQRARARPAQRRGGRGRRRGDHVPQPPRLDRRRGRLQQARRARAVPQHRVLRSAADRRRQAREAEGADPRPRVRGGPKTPARGASATSPGTTPTTARRRTRGWRT